MMDRDRRLAEMMGICVNWEPDASVYAYGVCKNCGDRFFNHFAAPDFSTPEWRARLMDWAVEQEWYWDFEEWIGNEKFPDTPEGIMFTQYLWRNLPALVAEYHGWKGEGR